jgi:hypothetical protein
MKDFSAIGRKRGNVAAENFKVISRMKKSRETSEWIKTWSGFSS